MVASRFEVTKHEPIATLKNGTISSLANTIRPLPDVPTTVLIEGCNIQAPRGLKTKLRRKKVSENTYRHFDRCTPEPEKERINC